MTYPKVLEEDGTLHLVCAGRSISRYGDGEFRLMIGTNRSAQPHCPKLAGRLKEILRDSGDCMVGIPNLVGSVQHKPTPKMDFWRRYMGPWVTEHLADRQYCSSFITRPDSAPWINQPDYWAKVRTIWAGRDVTLVRGGNKSLTAKLMREAKSVREVIGPRINAWGHYDELLDEIGTPDHPVLLCLGITATVMAVDLCAKGLHAIDAGHIGMFLKRTEETGTWQPK
jgi:hypothetical protein